MVKNHLKAIAAPKKWPIKRKRNVFVLKPSPGTHSLKNAVSLNFMLIEMLKLARTKRESRYILHNKEVFVDGKRRKDISFTVGLFDIVSIKDIKKEFRVCIGKKGKIEVIEIDEKEAGLKPYKIVGKNLIKGKEQLNFFDGTNMLIDKGDYRVGDTLLMDIAKKEVKHHLKLEKGNVIFLIGGKHISCLGIIEDVMENKIIYKIQNEVYETLKKYAFVVGKDKPLIKLN